MSYEILQQYWWFLVSLLGALLVFLMFVQGANSALFCLGHTAEERRLLINSTGRKWEFTFTHACHFWRSILRFVPSVLQHQLRWSLLAMDDNLILIRIAGCKL
jgi:cytochrome bd-type quinol oxidase subunit 2